MSAKPTPEVFTEGFTRAQLQDLARYKEGQLTRAERRVESLSAADPRREKAIEWRDRCFTVYIAYARAAIKEAS